MRTWAILVALPLVVLAAPLLAYIVPATVGADVGLVVLSGSMVPSFSPGDIVFVEDDVDYADLGVGDVITFQAHPGSPVTYTHRIIEVVEDQRGRVLQTKGDANEAPDPMLVNEQMVVGRVEHVLPWYGHIVVHFDSKLLYLAMSVLSMLVIATEVPGLFEDHEPARFAVVGPAGTAPSSAPTAPTPPAPSDVRTFQVVGR